VRSRKVVEGAGGLSNVSVEVSEARCECVKGWGGANCSVACPDTCHQRGRCLLTSADLAPQGMALRLDAALEMATQADAHDALFAARHRRAQRAQCLCDAGYHGASCGEMASCPSGCSGHGTCALGICSCELGWEGDACDVDGRGWQLELSSCPNHCSGNGHCEAGRCVSPFLDALFQETRQCKTQAVFSGIAKFEKDQRLVFDITVREGRDVAVNLAIA